MALFSPFVIGVGVLFSYFTDLLHYEMRVITTKIMENYRNFNMPLVLFVVSNYNLDEPIHGIYQ